MSTLPASEEIRTAAPAKLNLALRVLRKRPDGYHEIDSVFVPIDLSDEIAVTRGGAAGIRIRCDRDDVPCDARNTAWKAATALLGTDRPDPGVEIAITKRIPAGAGLGGGSSDAASVLRALFRLGAAPPPGETLAGVALRVGADVPFFLDPRPARVRGIGERIEPLEREPRASYAVAWPGVAVSTAWAYGALERTLTSPGGADTISRFLSGDWPFEGLSNDFEQVVGRRHPGILELKGRLLSLGARAATMSGSGSAVFGVFRDRAGAEAAARAVRSSGTWCEGADLWKGGAGPVDGR